MGACLASMFSLSQPIYIYPIMMQRLRVTEIYPGDRIYYDYDVMAWAYRKNARIEIAR
jgi:hypothetical protein